MLHGPIIFELVAVATKMFYHVPKDRIQKRSRFWRPATNNEGRAKRGRPRLLEQRLEGVQR